MPLQRKTKLKHTESETIIQKNTKTKNLGMFFFVQNESYRYRNLHLRLTKIIETSDKIQFDTNQTNLRFHHLQMYL